MKSIFTGSLVARYHDPCGYAKPLFFHIPSILYQMLSTIQRVGLGVHTSGLSRKQDDQVRSLRICFLASLNTPTGSPIDGLALLFGLGFHFWSGLLGCMVVYVLTYHGIVGRHSNMVHMLHSWRSRLYRDTMYMFEQDGVEWFLHGQEGYRQDMPRAVLGKPGSGRAQICLQ